LLEIPVSKTANRTLTANLEPVVVIDNPGYSGSILRVDLENKGASAVTGWKLYGQVTPNAPLRDITPGSVTAADGYLVVTPAPRAPTLAQGSGFVISADGYVVTNNHVIDGAQKIQVSFDDREKLDAELVGTDPRTDLALLKINAPGKLKPVYLGDSDKVQVGDWAIAIGNPFGLDRTFTVGVVSAIGRRDVDMMGGSHIQTDASINPGNSGGPLINIYGEVIGINRMIYSQSGGDMGIGFAIPMNTARSILEQLKTHKKIKRGFIGVSIAVITEEYARELGLKSNEGAFVGEVIQGGPGDRGGLMVGDIILKIDDKDIASYKDLLKIVSETPVGKTLKLTVWRKRKMVNLYVRVGERPE